MRTAAVALSFVASATAAAINTTGPPLPMGELGWGGVVNPGGPKIEVWGNDLDEIEAKIKKYHHEFSIYSEEEEEVPEVSADPAVVARGVLEARLINRNCDTRYGEVNDYLVGVAIENLKRVAGNQCKTRARTCIRTKCVNGAAIGLCNDNYHEIVVP
ncbi:hypothetical protein ACJ41O_012194 [Fusarium nematophilum]